MKNLFEVMRIHQWIKNLFVFAALIFAEQLFDFVVVGRSIGAFLLFSLTASGVYVLNDIFDKTLDENHPEKRNRPVAAQKMSIQTGYGWAFLLLLFGIGGGYILLGRAFCYVVLSYLVLNIFYSRWLKHIVIVDVLVVAVGFVLRAVAGAVAIHVYISPWLLIATFFLALFLILGKRRHELLTSGSQYRPVLKMYTPALLDGLLVMVTTAALVMYALYTMSERTIQNFGTEYLVYTIVFVVYGVFRAYYLIYEKDKGGAPTEMLLRDRPLQTNLLLWMITIIFIIYGK